VIEFEKTRLATSVAVSANERALPRPRHGALGGRRHRGSRLLLGSDEHAKGLRESPAAVALGIFVHGGVERLFQ